MVVAVVVVWVVEVPGDDVVHVIAVLDLLVAGVGSVLMSFVMVFAVMPTCARVRFRFAHGDASVRRASQPQRR